MSTHSMKKVTFRHWKDKPCTPLMIYRYIDIPNKVIFWYTIKTNIGENKLSTMFVVTPLHAHTSLSLYSEPGSRYKQSGISGQIIGY